MAKYFTLNELTRSTTASAEGISNVPSQEAADNLMYLANNLLDKIRERWGAPIKVNSGYRSPKLNERLKGSKTSQHMTGQAADITTGMAGSNKVLFDLIRTMQKDGEIEFDQLIDENNYTWIHVSLKKTGNRNEIKHLKQWAQ